MIRSGGGGGGPVRNCKSMTRWTSVRRNARPIRSDGQWNKIWVTRASNPHSQRRKGGGERRVEERKNEVKTRERKEKRKKKEAATAAVAAAARRRRCGLFIHRLTVLRDKPWTTRSFSSQSLNCRFVRTDEHVRRQTCSTYDR